MLGGLEEGLVLVLPAELDEGADGGRQLGDAGHGPVDGGAGAAVGPDAAGDDEVVGFSRSEEPSVHLGPLGPLAHHGAVGPRPHEQLAGRDEGGLAGAGLAGEHGEARGGGKGGPADEGDVSHVDFVDHGAPFLEVDEVEDDALLPLEYLEELLGLHPADGP